MIPLNGRTEPVNWSELTEDVWRVVGPDVEPLEPSAVCRVPEDWDDDVPAGFSFYLVGLGPEDEDFPDLGAATLRLPERLTHISSGDVLSVHSDGRTANVLWKATARHNSILLTERCDNYCLMCSQPPKDRDDSWLYDRAKKTIGMLPDTALSVGFTGGEPTIYPEKFLELLEHCSKVAPALQLHVLSNGRKFAEPAFTARYAAIPHEDIMVGIPLYAPEPTLHDFVVQSVGAFDETVRGILNLATHGQRIEIRIVVQKHTVPILTELATYIVRNLPFVEQVVLMGLEMTGLARPNSDEVWIDPLDYQEELSEAIAILDAGRVFARIYNHQLCVLPPDLWRYSVQSISDWKNDYEPICNGCAVREQCAGVFTTSNRRISRGLAPITPSV